MIPLRILSRDPIGLGSADSPGACRCDDGCDYAIKDTSSHPKTPHNEWFCSSLARAIGIAGPQWAIIEESPGTFMFGSRWEGGLSRGNWWDKVRSGDIPIDDIKSVLSKILAFDHFIYNEDRHLNNYLVREQRNGWAVLAFDYSRAWLYAGFPPHHLPFDPSQKTRLAFKTLQNYLGLFIDLGAISECLSRLRSVSDDDVAKIISLHPDNWLTMPEAYSILSWWRSKDRLDRIDRIEGGIKDGSYL